MMRDLSGMRVEGRECFNRLENLVRGITSTLLSNGAGGTVPQFYKGSRSINNNFVIGFGSEGKERKSEQFAKSA